MMGPDFERKKNKVLKVSQVLALPSMPGSSHKHLQTRVAGIALNNCYCHSLQPPPAIRLNTIIILNKHKSFIVSLWQ